MKNSLDHRYIARFIVEARTALFVGSGDSSLLNDAVIQRDSFGFPMIPGTTITGVIRHKLSEDSSTAEYLDDIFGHADGDLGKGSRIRISNASMI
ncbi:MAG: RAMP superfamily CRISPR-associated protein, partial [Saprospiraceae bacterium]